MAKLNVANRTAFLGDNLPRLRGLNSNAVDCIYLDPPFNKKRIFHAITNKADRHEQFKDCWLTPPLRRN